MTAARDNSGKAPLSFILQFPTAVSAFARVKELGAVKYERDNWKKGGKPDWEYLDACLRHIMAFMEGETYAEDTGCTHLAHAMWNIAALQDLNYRGVIYDKGLFDKMIEYWTARRAAEKEGQEFPSVEEWMACHPDHNGPEGEADPEQNPDFFGNEIDLEIGPDEDWREAARRRIDSMILGKLHNLVRNGRPLDAFTEEFVKRELQERQAVVGATEGTRAAQDLLDEVLESDSSTFDKLQMPGVFEGTIEFAKPITCRSGDSVNVDLEEGTVQVLNSDGEEVCSTTIVSEQPKPVFDLKAPTVQSEILTGEPEVCNLGSVDLSIFLDPGIEEAAEELSRVGGVSIAGARDAINQALNAFTLFSDIDPLENMMAGNIVTTVEEPGPGELLGSTDRPLDEIREQAKQDILRHTRDHTASNAALDELIGHPSHLRFIKQKQDEAFRRGYQEALNKVKENLEMETGDCGPDCDCGRYELGS